jgi:predicted MPP superfamily phosphohydrolase
VSGDLVPWAFRALALATLVGLPAYAWRVRGRAYATFGFVILGLSLPGAVVSHALVTSTCPPSWKPWLDATFLYGMAAAAAHLAHLVRARLRRWPFRLGVSIPGQVFVAAGFMATFWQAGLLPVRALVAGLDADAGRSLLAWLDHAPLALAIGSILTSTRSVTERVRIYLGRDGPFEVSRVPVERYRWRRPAPLAERTLRVVQITDPHIGAWQTVRRLRRRVAELAAHDPDLVLLTGDFLTMESRGTPGALADALAPLRRLPGRCFACFGNHDHESPEVVRAALRANGIALLVDAEAIAETAAGPVQIVGADWVRREREAHLKELLSRFPRREGHLRVLLLHDPSAFVHVPPGEVDLTLSGHTHGGQVGLVSLGLDWTVLSRTRWPDHGLFAHGSNRLYVHRGTGFYGFPLRVGVPGEHSILELVF